MFLWGNKGLELPGPPSTDVTLRGFRLNLQAVYLQGENQEARLVRAETGLGGNKRQAGCEGRGRKGPGC